MLYLIKFTHTNVQSEHCNVISDLCIGQLRRESLKLVYNIVGKAPCFQASRKFCQLTGHSGYCCRILVFREKRSNFGQIWPTVHLEKGKLQEYCHSGQKSSEFQQNPRSMKTSLSTQYGAALQPARKSLNNGTQRNEVARQLRSENLLNQSCSGMSYWEWYTLKHGNGAPPCYLWPWHCFRDSCCCKDGLTSPVHSLTQSSLLSYCTIQKVSSVYTHSVVLLVYCIKWLES